MVYNIDKIRLLRIFWCQICFVHQVGGAFDFDDVHLEVDQAGMTNSINSKFEHFEFGKYNKSLGDGIQLQDFVAFL